MLRRLATPLRILVLLVMFFTGSTGHHIAMAAGPSHDHHSVSVDQPEQVGHHGELADCTDGNCGQSEQSCCVMGQCLLALGCQPYLQLPAALASDQCPTPCMVLVPAVTALPFRPPLA